MNINHTKIALELNSIKNYNIIEVRQGDIGTRYIDATFTINGELLTLAPTTIAKVNATVNNIIVAEDVTAIVDTTNNFVTIELTENMLNLPGLMKVDVILMEDNELITAETFSVRVGRSVINSDATFKPQGGTVSNFLSEVAAARGTHTNLGARLTAGEAVLHEKANKATTLEGYGITNAYTVNEINNMLNSSQVTATFDIVKNSSKMCHIACDYLKKSIVKIMVTADNGVINPDSSMAIGITDAEGNSVSNVASVKLNKETLFVLPKDTKSINIWVNSFSASGTGNMTVVVEHLGILDNIADISNNLLTMSNDITNLSGDLEKLNKNIDDLETVSLNTFDGKSFSIIGDSYSAFKGWIPDGYSSFYLTDTDASTVNKVTSSKQMWWDILSKKLKMSLICNDSWSGTTICTTGYNGVIDTTKSFVVRAKALLGEQKTTSVKPDVIFIFGGTNDKWANSPIGSLKYSDWTDDDKKSVLPAFCYLVDYIKLYNPHAIIVNIVNTGLGAEITSGMVTACEHYGVINVELSDIDKNGGHPSSVGQAAIADQVIQALQNYDDKKVILGNGSSLGSGIPTYSKSEIDSKLNSKLSTADTLNDFDAATTETGKLPTISAVKGYLNDYYFDANKILDIFSGDNTILDEYDVPNAYYTKTEINNLLTSNAPVKGVDYFTANDINSIVNAVYAKVADGTEVAY